MDIPCHIANSNAMATKDMDVVIQRLVAFLSRAQQVTHLDKHLGWISYRKIGMDKFWSVKKYVTSRAALCQAH